MKTQSLPMGLVFLVAAFIWGCQEQGSGPVAPQAPQLIGPPTLSASATYTYTHLVDVTTAPSTAIGLKGAGKKSNQVVMSGSGGDDAKIIFSKDFADQFDPTRMCFPRDGDFNTLPVDFSGALLPGKKNNPSRVTGQYFFRGKGTGGEDFKYQLELRGTVMSGTFAPDPTETVVVTWDGMNAAEMNTEGKGKGKKGGNAGSACVGTKTISGTVTIVGT